jgi:hypothetical protein
VVGYCMEMGAFMVTSIEMKKKDDHPVDVDKPKQAVTYTGYITSDNMTTTTTTLPPTRTLRATCCPPSPSPSTRPPPP